MYEPKLERLTISEILTKDFSEYVLPLIQREYVWDASDVKEMIESLLNGYPIGIITIIKTDIDLPSIPLADAENASERVASEKYYILDGQQRLTSLLLIRDGWKIKRLGEPIDITPIFYNPDDNKLRVKGKRAIGHDFSTLIRKGIFKEPAEPYLRKILEYLGKNFLNRPLAFYMIEVKKGVKTEEEIYKDMAEIFTRINRAGIRLGNLEMFLSFFASASLGKEEITKLHKEMNEKFSMDLEPIIRFVFSNLGLTQSQISKVISFKKAIDDVRKRYRREEVVEIIEKCKESIFSTMSLLHTQLGITTTQILPSETALVPLFQYIYERGMNGNKFNEEASMVDWFILASFNGLYSSRTDTRLEDDIKIVKGAKDSFPLDKLLNSMKEKINRSEISEEDFKNIDMNILRGNVGKKYLFMLYILLHRNNATDWAGRPLSERNFNDLARHHIFPKEDLREREEDEIIINHLGNLTFIDQNVNGELQNRLPHDYLNEYEQILKKHFIPTNKRLWELDNYVKFVDERMNLLWNAYCEMFKRPLSSTD